MLDQARGRNFDVSHPFFAGIKIGLKIRGKPKSFYYSVREEYH